MTYASWLLAGLFFVAMPVAAQPVSNFAERVDTAQRMILTGDPESARKVLEDLRVLAPDEPEVLFLLAHLAVSQQDYDKAIDLYRRILVKEPSAVRVRLELARLLFKKLDDEAASHHFRLVLGEPDLPPKVIENIEVFLAEIQARKRWHVGLTVALAPDSNINT